MGFSGNISGGRVEWSKIIMVDGNTGDDTTGERGRADKPFKTIQAAIDVYQEDDLIDVLPSDYVITSPITTVPLATIEKRINFREGARVLADFAQAIFLNSGSLVSGALMRIYGKGEFINTYIGSNYGGSSIAAGPVAFHGAKKIESGVQGSGNLGASFLFGTTGNSAIYENIDEIINWKGNGVCIAISTQDIDDEWHGVIRNCKKIGDLNATAVGLGINGNTLSEKSILVENTNVYSESIALIMSQGYVNAVLQNCVFKSAASYAGLIAKHGIFDNCHFTNTANGIPTVIVQNQQYLTEEPLLMPTFNNCTFRNNGNNVAFNSATKAIFSGVNKFWTAGVNAANGFSGVRNFNQNYGTIIANVMTQVVYSQSWAFNLLSATPTVGETYTITAPDGATISYVVQPADTRTEIINALVIAWDAEVVANPTGFFAKFDNKTVFTGPTIWRITGAAIDPNDGTPPNSWTLDTDGSDLVLTTNNEPSQFAWKGNGKFVTDEELIMPNY